MSDQRPSRLDRLALAFGLGGVLLGALIAIAGKLFGQDFVMPGFALFASAQVLAIVLGLITRQSLLGKSAAITSGILLSSSVLWIA